MTAPTMQSRQTTRNAAIEALDALRDAVDDAHTAGDLTPALGHWTGELHGTGRELLPRLDILGPSADDARTAIAQAASHARLALAKYRTFPVESRRITPGSKRPSAALIAEPPKLKSPHAEVISQISGLAHALEELSSHTDLTATRDLTTAGHSTQAVADLVATVSAYQGPVELDGPTALAPAPETVPTPTAWEFPRRRVLLLAGVFAAVLATAGACHFTGHATPAAPVALTGSPTDTASPTPTGTSPTPWTPEPADTPDTPDPCAGIPVPDTRYGDYRERWVRAGYPVECLDPLPFDGAVGPDADAARTAYAAEHPDDPVYASDAPLSIRVWKRIRDDASAAASSWADRSTTTEGNRTP